MTRVWLFVVALIAGLAACSPKDLPYTLQDLPSGDAQRGMQLFTQSINGAPACSHCHTTDGTKKVGPSLEGYSMDAGNLVKGQNADEYTFYSILRPATYVVRGYSNVMYGDYGDKLTRQDVADLIVYLLGL